MLEISSLRPRIITASYLVCGCLLGTVGFSAKADADSIPGVIRQSFSDVGTSSVTLKAIVNPGGESTAVSFEYGTSTAYASGNTAVRVLPSGSAEEVVAAEVSGLEPDTDYHFRAIATNALGTTRGFDEELHTFAIVPALPDGRVYEMVTPPENHNADIYVPTSGLPTTGHGYTNSELTFQAAGGGEAVTYVGDSTSGGNGAASGGELGNQYLSVRTAAGWSQENISPPVHFRIKYDAFSEDLKAAVLGPLRIGREPAGSSALVPGAPNGGYRVLYSRDDESRVEQPLFSTIPATVEPFEFTVRFAGGSTDFSTMVFDASAALTPEASAGNNIYENHGGTLRLINTLPSGVSEPDAFVGAPSDSEEGTPEMSHAVSTDGSRVIWSGLTSHGLYSTEGDVTTQIDVSQAGGPGGGGEFWTASNDGNEIYFTDDASAHLTSDTLPGSGSNLYRYTLNDHGLQDLTAASDAGVQGVIGASSDGSYVYFVADGALSKGATTGGCELPLTNETSHNECNLYVWRKGLTRLIAPLSEEDGLAVPPITTSIRDGVGDWVRGLDKRTANMAASGKAVTFVSTGELTNYDNEGATEVYVYDAESDVLSCASCDSSGQPPQLSDRARNVAGVPAESWTETRALRTISDDGTRVFFNSNVPLVPQDTNENVDVYEWERGGVGSCTERGGCIYLLSGGKSDDDSYLLDASATGDDVFLVTRAPLVEADGNEDFDVYDVRANGVVPQGPLPCANTDCSRVPAPPVSLVTPPTEDFDGIGNFAVPLKKIVLKAKAKEITRAEALRKALLACRKKRKHSRSVCEKRATKKYAAKPRARNTARGRK